MALLRSNAEFAKRVFLDRLTTDQQGLLQADPGDIDQGPGDVYDYGGVYNPYNLGVGADCSGSAGVFIDAAVNGPNGMSWSRLFTTETFPGPFSGFRQTTQSDLLGNYYPIKVCIGHYGGGPDSHMHISIDGIVMESNGDNGTCTLGHGAMTDDDPFWNDWWVFDGPITEDTSYRCSMAYAQGVDYAGGAISGADLASAGKKFVCRYVTDGGADLPGKLLTAEEFTDLCDNGIAVVFNWESDAQRMLDGHDAGVSDAQTSLNYIRGLPGISADYQPVVYFSADFDAAPEQQDTINGYLQGCASVLGGVNKVGLYGGYWPLSRALNAGVCGYGWQTEAWSGGNIDSRVNIVQRNNLGYQTIGGVECDIDEAHTDDFGQYAISTPPGGSSMTQPDVAPDGETYARLAYEQLIGEIGDDGYGHGWPELGNRSVVDYLAQVVGPGIQQLQATLTAIASKSK